MPQNDPLFDRINYLPLELATEFRGPIIVKNLLVRFMWMRRIIVSWWILLLIPVRGYTDIA